MMALDGKTIIKEEITEKDAYDAQTAASAVAVSAAAAAAAAAAAVNANRNRNNNNNKANNNNNSNSNSISSSKESPTTNGINNNSNSNSTNNNNGSNSSHSSSNNNTLTATNGSRTPDSPESTRIVAPRSPMSPQLHHASMALAPPPPMPLPLPLPRPNRNASASPVTSSPPPTQPPSAALAAAAAHVEQARMLGKIRKFLGSLVHIAQEVHPEVSERVRALVISLASGGISIDEFRLALQEAINLPLRAYVMPLLKQHIALLQREIVALARATNQTTLQYVTSNENSVMEFAAHGPPPEYSDIFVQLQDAPPPPPPNANGGGLVFKRRPSDSLPMEHHNGLQEWSEYMSAAKRLHTAYQPQLAAAAAAVGHSIVGQPTLFEYAASAGVANAAADNGYGGANHRDERDLRMATANEAQRHGPTRSVMPSAAGGGGGVAGGGNNSNNNASNAALGMPAAGVGGGGGEEEWKNIHTMLNCISAMVDKTKRAITILQQRGIEPQQPNCQEVTPATLAEIRRQTEEKVAEFKRNAEEAVNQVKRQAVIEIQRAIVAAETRSAEIMAQERLRMEKFLVDMSRHTSGERERDREREREIDNKSPSLASAAQTACWNCGRKATETCSGCNFARYCGSFCQHRDWDSHHQICGTTRVNEHGSKHAASVGAQVLPLTAANLRGTMAIRSPPTPNAPPAAHAQPTVVTQAQQPASSSSSSGGGGGGGGGPPNALVPNGVGSK